MGDEYSPRNSGKKRSHDDDDPKKKKNRDAARKCREKKVLETESLKKKNEELVKKNEELADKKKELEDKLRRCIDDIKKHEESGCNLPQKVLEILRSSEYVSDFIPVGLQTFPPATGAHDHGHCNGAHMSQETEMIPTEPEPTVTGLFSGNQLPAVHVQRSKCRSCRSSSRSPPPQALSPQLHTATSSSKRTSNPSKPMSQPSWARLHQQTVGEQSPTGLSPAQTVPNIDSDQYTVPDTYQNNAGFPNVDQAVKEAQEDPGVVEDGDYENVSNHCLFSGPSLSSLGFTTNGTSGFTQNQFVLDNSIIRPVRNNDVLKPKTSTSTVVSMKNTAELLSQAMTNFDASEISEDLKRQIAQLANNQTEKEAEGNSQYAPAFVHNDCVIESGNMQEQLTNQTEAESNGNSSMITYETLLELAKNGEQNITVQYKDKEYSCNNYEQVKALLQMVNQDNESQGAPTLPQTCYIDSSSMVVDNAPANNFSQGSSILSDNSLNTIQEVAQAMLSQNSGYFNPNQLSTQSQNNTFDQVQTSTFNLAQSNTFNQPQGNPFIQAQSVGFNQAQSSAFNQSQNSTFIQAHSNNYNLSQNNTFTTPRVTVNNMQVPMQVVEVQDQVQLPTTVLSMIEEDAMTRPVEPSNSNEMFLDSIDYSENVKDLPSLSLTEDHTHIFEKKRRTNNE